MISSQRRHFYASTYHCDAIAATTAVVRLYPKAILLAELTRHPKLAQSFAARLARQVMELRARLARRSIRSARERILHYLRHNAGPDGRTVAMTGTLRELAADLGLTEEALYRTLARMAADGDIKRTGRTITLSRTI